MEKNKVLNEKGFTLLEVMIASAIGSIIFYGIFMMFRLGGQQANALNSKMTVQDTARHGMNSMLQELRETEPSKIIATNNSITFQIPQGVDDHGVITWGQPITYTVPAGNTQLVRQQGAASRIIANDINNLDVTLNTPTNPTMVTLRLDFQRQTVEGRLFRETLIGQGKVRND